MSRLSPKLSERIPAGISKSHIAPVYTALIKPICEKPRLKYWASKGSSAYTLDESPSCIPCVRQQADRVSFFEIGLDKIFSKEYLWAPLKGVVIDFLNYWFWKNKYVPDYNSFIMKIHFSHNSFATIHSG